MSAAPELEPIATGGESASPFLQLHFYRQEDQDRFAGRDDEINAVVTGILSFDTFVLYGRSGLGKTSLLLAGVFPQLAQRGMTPVYTRVLDLPVGELRKKIEADIEALPGTVVLILDQFEEFFIRIREQNDDHPSRRMEACREMSTMLQDVRRRFGSRVRLLFGIREDYYAELEDFRAELPAIAAHGFRLLPLTAYGARRAIILMLERSHPPVVYEQTLVNTLLDEIGRTGFDPLLLQIICSEVWREAHAKRPGTNELRAEDLESVGGFEQIFQRYVERAAKATIDPLLVRVLLDTLITADQTKRVVRASDLLRDGAATRLYVRASKDEVDELLSQLVELQLVRPVGESRERFELLHDRLVPVVKKWLESDKTFVDFRFAKKFVDSMASDGAFRTNIGRLISDEQMTQIVERYALRLQLTPDDTELLFRSSVHNGDRDAIQYWASRLDELDAQRSTKTIGEMLDHPYPQVRAAAASATRALESARAFVPRLLQMAMQDHPEVREPAARSFATLASDADLELLAESSGTARDREPATAVVVECFDQLRPTHHFPWRIRRRAWLAVRKRSAAVEGEWIREAMVRGAIRGTVGGLLFALTVAFAVMESVRWNTEADEFVRRSEGERAVVVTLLAILGPAAGVLIGWASSRRMARRNAVGKWELFYGGPTRGITQALVIWVLAQIAWVSFGIPDPDTLLHVPASLALALPGIAMFLLALFAPRGRDQSTSGTRWLRLHRVWPWMALTVIALLTIVFEPLLDEALRDLFAASVIITILTIPIASGVLALRRRCRGDNAVTDMLWTLVLGGGVGALLTMGILWLVERLDPTENKVIVTAAGIAAIALLLGCFRAAVIGGAVDPVLKETLPPPRVRKAFRAFAIACVLLAFAGYVALFGVASIPWLGAKHRLANDVLTGELLQHLPNVHYHNITDISDPMRLVTFEPSAGYALWMASRYGPDKTPLSFAAAPFRIAVQRKGRVPGEYRLTMRAYAMRSGVADGRNVVAGELAREGNAWSARGLGEHALRTDVILWDPADKQAFELVNFVMATRGIVRTTEQVGAGRAENALMTIGRSSDLYRTTLAIPNPPGFHGSRLILIGVE